MKKSIHKKVNTIKAKTELLQTEEIVLSLTVYPIVKYASLSEELKSSLAKGIKELDEGKYISYAEIMNNIPKEVKAHRIRTRFAK